MATRDGTVSTEGLATAVGAEAGGELPDPFGVSAVGRGLKLSEEYFEATKGRVSAAFPRLYPRMAIGLIGHGSQCLGFDDRLSQDHDWGPQYCVFLQPADYLRYGEKLQRFLKTLPTEFRGFHVQWDRKLRLRLCRAVISGGSSDTSAEFPSASWPPSLSRHILAGTMQGDSR